MDEQYLIDNKTTLIPQMEVNAQLALSRVNDARAAIEQAKDLIEVLDIISLSRAAAVFYAAQGLEENAQVAREASLWAQRKAGEYLKGMPKNTGAMGIGPVLRFQDETTIEKIPTLTDLDIDKNESFRWQVLADIPEETFQEYIDQKVAKGYELTAGGLINIGKSIRKNREREEMAAKGAAAELPIDIAVSCGDFRIIMEGLPENSVDLIFTDPPYDEESIPLYADLARLGARVLKPGGSLITYVGHYAVGKIYNHMTPHLRFWWMLAVKHSGGAARLIGKNVYVHWKPLLWFVKERRADNEYVADLIESNPPTKTEHDWQQDTSEAEYYINHLTLRGGMILDPFAGSGTTLIAAHRLGRKAIGIEIDEERANVARNRIQAECERRPSSQTGR